MITKEQAERLITLIDTMIDVKTDLATATEESATCSPKRLGKQEK